MSKEHGRGVVAALIGAVAAVAALATAHAATPDLKSKAGLSLTPMHLSHEQISARGYGKLDASLIRVAEAARAAPGAMTVAALKQAAPGAHLALSAPSAIPAVLVEINIHGDPAAIKARLRQLGVTRSAQFKSRISAWVPADQLSAAAALSGVRSMRASMMRTHVGSVTTQGDFFQRSAALRASTLRPGLTGQGVTVGVLSDSFACTSDITSYDDDVASGDLPSGVQVLSELAGCAGATDEGRAMAQLIYDVAPGTQLKFYSAFNGEADFANGIIALADAGAQVIVDDVTYFDEPFFQDGIISQAVDIVTARGIPYFSSAGNSARDSYESSFLDSGVVGATGTDIDGEKLLNFDSSGATTATVLPITIPANSSILVYLQWDQPYANTGGSGAQNALDICLTDRPAGDITEADIIFCTGPTNIGDDPFQIFGGGLGNTADFEGGLVVGLVSGTAPGRVKVSYSGLSVDQFATASGTVQGHAGAAGTGSTGASYFRANPICLPDIYPNFTLEDYSSAGGTPILFDLDGNRLATPEVRQKPNFVGPDGGITTFFFQQIGARDSDVPACVNGATDYNFFGTSAAAPHVAGIAALLLQAQPKATPAQIFDSLTSTAIDMAAPGVDFDSGFGYVQADAALGALLPAITLSTTTLNFGPVVHRQATASKFLTLTNSGGSVLTLQGITLSGGGYATANNCGTSLPAGSSCSINVVFAPNDVRDYPATLNIASDARSDSPRQVAISGSGSIPPGAGAFGLMTLLPGLGLVLLRRRRRR